MAGTIDFSQLSPNAATQGAMQTNALLQTFARVRAGKALAAGDDQGAQDTLNSSGQLDSANQVQQQHWTQQEHIKALSDDQHKQSAQFAQDASSALYHEYELHQQDPDGGKGAVLSAFDQMAPIFSRRGAKPEDLSTYRTALEQNPEQFLNYIHTEATAHLARHVVGNSLLDENGTVLGTAPEKPQYEKLARPDGGEDLVRVGGGAPGATGAPAPAAGTGASAMPAPAAGAPTGAAPAGGLSGTDFYHKFVLPHEGGLNPSDMNGSPTNMGFNQKANPDIDVKSLTPDTAAQRFNDKYYVPSGADKLPPAMASVYADTYFINPTKAKEFLVASGGDPSKFMDQREAWMKSMVANNPKAAPYEKAWDTRNKNLREFSQGQGQPAAPAAPAAAPGNPNVVYSTPAATGPQWQLKTAVDGDGSGFRAGTTYRVKVAGKDVGDVRKLQDPLTPAAATPKVQQLNPNDAKFLNDQKKQLAENTTAAGELDRFNQLNATTETGGALNALPGVTQVRSTLDPKVAEMRAIVDRITPAMRNGLPGAASDRDVAMFRGATVGLDKPAAANKAIGDAFKAYTDRQGDMVAFMDQYAKSNGNLLGATEAWKGYTDAHPLFSTGSGGAIKVNAKVPWRSVISAGGQQQAAPVPAAPSAPRVRHYVPGKGFVDAPAG